MELHEFPVPDVPEPALMTAVDSYSIAIHVRISSGPGTLLPLELHLALYGAARLTHLTIASGSGAAPC